MATTEGLQEIRAFCLTHLESMLDEFHDRNGFSAKRLEQHAQSGKIESSVIDMIDDISIRLRYTARFIERMATTQQRRKDDRLYRLYLISEEFAEVCEALSAGDETDLLDGLVDLLYVVLGSIRTFDMPIAASLVEVHRANMSKKRRDPVANPRMRDKGDWTPPNLARVLQEARGSR